MRALLLAWLWCCVDAAHAGLSVGLKATPGSMPLDGAVIVAAPDADPLERFVAQDLAADFKRLGLRVAGKGPVQIWVGTAGHHPGIDAAGLDLGQLKGCWECFHIGGLASR